MTASGASPRVSFVICTCNQQRFIREAVAGALAQDYDNLEIVISDDASTDGTVKEIRAAISAYSGPHDVQLNLRSERRGILAHLYDAVAHSSGDFIVGAAGDDVSLPQRTRRLVEVWRETRAPAVCSGYVRVDETGAALETVLEPRPGRYGPARYFPGTGSRHIVGCSAGYGRELFERVPLPDEPIWAEDLFFSMMIALRSEGVAFIDEALVLYRTHGDAMNNLERNTDVATSERRSARFAALVAPVLELTLRQARGAAFADIPALERDLNFLRHRADWLDWRWSDRLRALSRVRQVDEVRWLLPRLLGLNGLKALRSLRP